MFEGRNVNATRQRGEVFQFDGRRKFSIEENVRLRRQIGAIDEQREDATCHALTRIDRENRERNVAFARRSVAQGGETFPLDENVERLLIARRRTIRGEQFARAFLVDENASRVKIFASNDQLIGISVDEENLRRLFDDESIIARTFAKG